MSKPEEHVAALRRLREELGISQKRLAKLTGFQGPEISQWELGKRSIKLWQFEALLNGLGYRLTWEPVSEEQDMAKGSGSGRRGKKPHGNPPHYQFDTRSLMKDLAAPHPAEPEPEAEEHAEKKEQQ